MSDTAILPYGSPASPEDEATDGANRRRLLLLITLGVVLAGVIGYLLVGKLFGGTDPVASSIMTSSPAPAPVVSGTPAAPPTPAPSIVAGAVGRNPFVPLVAAPAAGGAAAAPAAPAPAATPSAGSTTPGLTTFKVISVSGNRAVVTVDGARHSVSAGQTFARRYKLISTSDGSCAHFTRDGSRVGLCEGQTLIF